FFASLVATHTVTASASTRRRMGPQMIRGLLSILSAKEVNAITWSVSECGKPVDTFAANSDYNNPPNFFVGKRLQG
ncbi:MAG TPA: hypothetical protein VFW11_05800, partial [Cyclobacteriaceae bacterium]|nr:hypothetical protein [Cyclobacteriaceae bacterium]